MCFLQLVRCWCFSSQHPPRHDVTQPKGGAGCAEFYLQSVEEEEPVSAILVNKRPCFDQELLTSQLELPFCPTMFPVSSLRMRRFHRAILNPPWLVKNRLSDPKAVPGHSRSVSTCCHKKDTCHSNVNFTGFGKERGPFQYNNNIFWLRSCSTSEAELNCWKCKQVLVKTPSFFCSSCQTIQPPEERTSYFKIMDWWVSYSF